ncbi:MAG: protein kinase [Planctomycetota bacterium]|nr:protein kinase [Planctomycetota bacterium]
MKIGLLDQASRRYYPIKSNHVRIGSAENCHVVLDDASVGEFHAEIHITDVGIELHHKEKEHSTWVNDFKVTRYYLSHEDNIVFGQLTLDFVISEEKARNHQSCARCGVEISQFTTRRYSNSPRGVIFCGRCEALKSGGISDTKFGTPSPRPRKAPGSGSGEFNDPYGLLRDLDKKEDDLTRSLESMPELMPISVIARGAQGVIHKMRYHGQLVAVKRLKFDVSTNAKERFQRETKALRALDHPSLVKLIDSIEHENSAYLIMEYIDGPSLEAVLERRGRLSVKAALSYAIQVAEGILYLGGEGIIHRDIKPSNVIIDEKNHARLVDFGLVRFTANTHMLTAPGQMVGSPSYMSPEQVRAQNLTAKSDVFSLGITFYEALTGQRPFPGNTPIELFTAILEDPPPLEPFVDMPNGKNIAKVFSNLLAKTPDARPDPERALIQLKALFQDVKKELAGD